MVRNRNKLNSLSVTEGTNYIICIQPPHMPNTNNFYDFPNCSSAVNVTFWDNFAVSFYEMMSNTVQKPVILIISGCKVGKWNGKFCFHPNLLSFLTHLDLSLIFSLKVKLIYQTTQQQKFTSITSIIVWHTWRDC